MAKAISTKLSNICPFRLNEIYEILFELHEKLGIRDDFYSTISTEVLSSDAKESLQKLMEASKLARDDLITWYHKQTLFEIHVTISLITAKIRYIEYKLGLCEPYDLHQSCSIALVDFTNVLAEMTVYDKSKQSKKPKKTMTMVSTENDMPVWLSHYRNLICHAPLESPNITILIQLVAKALNYINESFWSRLLVRSTFNAQKCMFLIEALANYTKITSINQQLVVKDDRGLSKNAAKAVAKDLNNCKKFCYRFKTALERHPDQVIELVIQYITRVSPYDKSKNYGLLLEQMILTSGSFEKFVFRLWTHVKEKPDDPKVINWFRRVVNVVSYDKGKVGKNLRKSLTVLNINISIKIIRCTNIHPIKCCHLANEVMKLERPWVGKIVRRLRFKLIPIIGVEQARTLFDICQIVNATPNKRLNRFPVINK